MSDDNMVTRIYGNFRGVDFRGEEIDLTRSPDCVNMWKNYKQTSGISTRPGWMKRGMLSETVYGIFFFKDEMIVHCGSKLYTITGNTSKEIYSGLNKEKSCGFAYGNDWYFKDGKHYLKYDGTTISTVKGYVPTTSIGRSPAGGGTAFEPVNMLTGWRINTFLADGKSAEYMLDSTEIDKDQNVVVKVNDQVVKNYTVDHAAGKIVFTSAPSEPLTDGQDNVSVEFCKTVDGYRNVILGCRLAQIFDNRVFFSGNPEFPSNLWHCSLDDPSYCSDLDYYTEGKDEAAIRGMVAGNNALWVFREPSDANTTVFYHTPTLDSDYGKIYPSSHSSVTTGCIGTAINFHDDIVFFSDRGAEGVSGDITTEQVVAHRSSLVDRLLTEEEHYRDMVLAEWEGYLLVCIGEHIYLADSRAVFTNEDHIEYEWFYWEMDRSIVCACVHEGVAYFGTNEGVFALTDLMANVKSYWVTPKDKFKYPHRQKTTNKRGCVAEAEGDVEVYVKTEDSDFEQVGVQKGVTDYFVSRIKQKKFKDIQLMFHSQSRFRLETVTLECFVGGYIKR